MLVKLAPDFSETKLEQAVESIRVAGIDGVIATNTTISRAGLASPLAWETGGLSGATLTEQSTAAVRRIRQLAGDGLPIVACGGVMSADDARAKLDAGACRVQIYTGLIYEGPGETSPDYAEVSIATGGLSATTGQASPCAITRPCCGVSARPDLHQACRPRCYLEEVQHKGNQDHPRRSRLTYDRQVRIS